MFGRVVDVAFRECSIVSKTLEQRFRAVFAATIALEDLDHRVELGSTPCSVVPIRWGDAVLALQEVEADVASTIVG